MSSIVTWLIALLAVVAVWVDIPHHRIDLPFGCPGICIHFAGIDYDQEIKTHLGLDLQGGTELVLRLDTSKLPAGSTTPVSTLNEQARGVIERRINGLGVSEPVIQSLGTDQILVQLPGVSDLKEAQDLVTKQAYLEFKVPDPKTAGQFVSLDPPLTGAHLKPTYVTFDNNGQPVVNFEFSSPDDQRWVELSKKYEKQQVQIVLDGKPISSPVIEQVFTSGKGIIQGNFTPQSAKELSLLLNSGALPVPLEVIQSNRVDATLGADSVRRSLIAGAIGMLLVALFMILYYRLPGLLADVALLFYTILAYAVFRLVPVTLTLAGIAGFILSIGMAVDANVLTFERLKEELRAGRSLRAAVEEGRKRAFPSIWYSNLATVITAFILFQFGTGEVKGFALTLGIGVVVSFFTAVIVTQLLLRLAIEVNAARKRWLYGVEERPTEAGGVAPRAAQAART